MCEIFRDFRANMTTEKSAWCQCFIKQISLHFTTECTVMQYVAKNLSTRNLSVSEHSQETVLIDDPLI